MMRKLNQVKSKTLLFYILIRVPAIGAPRIKNTINARPIVPAYKGV